MFSRFPPYLPKVARLLFDAVIIVFIEESDPKQLINSPHLLKIKKALFQKQKKYFSIVVNKNKIIIKKNSSREKGGSQAHIFKTNADKIKIIAKKIKNCDREDKDMCGTRMQDFK